MESFRVTIDRMVMDSNFSGARRFLWALAGVSLAAACAPMQTKVPGAAPDATAPGSLPAGGVAGPYLDLLAAIGPGNPAMQAVAFESARSAWQAAATPQNTLRYGLLLGAPGHVASNPAEAGRMLARLLDTPEGLSPEEIKLARVFLREFEARLALYADLAREREQWEGRLHATESAARAQATASAADSARLRRERDALKEKLDGIAEIERSMMERDAEPVPTPPEAP